jgi:hypothetical protein
MSKIKTLAGEVVQFPGKPKNKDTPISQDMKDFRPASPETVREWADEHVAQEDGESVIREQAFLSYKNYMVKSNLQPVSETVFYRCMSDMGYKMMYIAGKRRYVGIVLL